MKKIVLYSLVFAAVTALSLAAADLLLLSFYGLLLTLLATAAVYFALILLTERVFHQRRKSFVRTGLAAPAVIAALLLAAGLIPAAGGLVSRWTLFVLAFFALANTGCLALAAIVRLLLAGDRVSSR